MSRSSARGTVPNDILKESSRRELIFPPGRERITTDLLAYCASAAALEYDIDPGYTAVRRARLRSRGLPSARELNRLLQAAVDAAFRRTTSAPAFVICNAHNPLLPGRGESGGAQALGGIMAPLGVPEIGPALCSTQTAADVNAPQPENKVVRRVQALSAVCAARSRSTRRVRQRCNEDRTLGEDRAPYPAILRTRGRHGHRRPVRSRPHRALTTSSKRAREMIGGSTSSRRGGTRSSRAHPARDRGRGVRYTTRSRRASAHRGVSS